MEIHTPTSVSSVGSLRWPTPSLCHLKPSLDRQHSRLKSGHATMKIGLTAFHPPHKPIHRIVAQPPT